MLLLEALAVLLAADAASGLVHWAEDRYGNRSTPIIGRWIVEPNILHHRRGTDFVSRGWLESSWDLLAVGAIVLLATHALDRLTWHVWFFVLLGVNANQIHKWNHMPRSRIPNAVRLLQALGLLQSAKHHARHHQGAKDTHYCVITPFLNPLLDRSRFWHRLEQLVTPLARPGTRE